MSFLRYPDINGSHHEGYVAYFLRQHPELADVEYTISEKVHGANFQVYFEPHMPWQYGKRRHWIGKGEKFFGIWQLVEQYSLLFERIQRHIDVHGFTIRLYGEIYGPGVQKKGVTYLQRGILFFDMMLNGKMLAPAAFESMSWRFPLLRANLVPAIAMVRGLQVALDFDTDFLTRLNPVAENICEGVVMRPWLRVYYSEDGEQRFCLKKKNAKFMEKDRKPKPPSPGDPEVMRLNGLFKTYIVERRLQSTFSKIGPIERVQQLGDYIRYILEDAKVDFLKEHEYALVPLEKGEIRRIYNVGAMVANMLKAHIQQEDTSE